MAEFVTAEYYADLAARTDSFEGYWCAVRAHPALLCLDIAAASTLSNAFDLANFASHAPDEETSFLTDHAEAAGVNAFGQYDTCGGKSVGDGMINGFELATYMAVQFGDYVYAEARSGAASLSEVPTVQGRDDVGAQCRAPAADPAPAPPSRLDYLQACRGRQLRGLRPGGLGVARAVAAGHAADGAGPRAAPVEPAGPRAVAAAGRACRRGRSRGVWVPPVARDAAAALAGRADGGAASPRAAPPRRCGTAMRERGGHEEGAWYTLHLSGLSLRLHAVLASAPPRTPPSSRPRTRPAAGGRLAGGARVRFTRACSGRARAPRAGAP